MILRRPDPADDIAAGLGATLVEVDRVLATLAAARRITSNHRGETVYYEAAEKNA
jgi:hypothetical protein